MLFWKSVTDNSAGGKIMPTDFIHIQPDRSGLELSAPDYVWQPLPYTNPEATRILFMGLNVPGYYSHPIRLLSLMVCEDADLNQKFDPRFFETETVSSNHTIW